MLFSGIIAAVISVAVMSLIGINIVSGLSSDSCASTTRNSSGGVVIDNLAEAVSSSSVLHDSWVGQRFSSGSALVGKTIDELTFQAFRDGAPESNLIIRVRDGSNSVKATLATISDATIDTDPENITITFSPVTIATGDMITFESASETTVIELSISLTSTIPNSTIETFDSVAWSPNEETDVALIITEAESVTTYDQNCLDALSETKSTAFTILGVSTILMTFGLVALFRQFSG